MASDVTKAVEIALKLTGVDPAKLTPLIAAFGNLDTSVKTSQASLDSLSKKLTGLKAPAGLATFTKSLQGLADVKLKDLSGLAENLKAISKIKSMPAIGTFVNNVQKLSTTSFAGFTGLVTALKAIENIKVATVTSNLSALNTAISALQKQGGLAAFGKFATDINAMTAALRASQGAVNAMGSAMAQVGNAAQHAGNKIRSFGDKVKTVLTFRMISEGIIHAKLAILGARDAIIEYDQALKDLQAITGATDAEVAQMGKTILDVASKTKFSATEVAQGMRVIGQAGFTASEAVQTMQGIADLATGTLSDMSQVVDLVTTTMRVFQISASESTMVVDVFANAVNRSKLTIEKLRTAMNYVGPIAKDAGVSFQESAAAMMTLANAGLRASTIGTSFRQVLAQLVDPSEKMTEAAKKAGVSLRDLDPTVNSFSHVLQNLGIVIADTGTAFDLFGKRGASAALALTTTGNQYNELLATVSQSGTAAQQAAKQMEGLGVSFKNLMDKLKNLAIVMGKGGIVTALKVFVDVARVLVDALISLADTIGGRVVFSMLTLATVTIAVTGAFIALKQALIASGIAAFVVKVVALTKTALVAGIAISKIAVIFSGIGLVIAGVITAIVVLFSRMSDGSKKAAWEASALAGEYNNLSQQIDNYRRDTKDLKDDSTELKNANVGLRQSLLDVAAGNDVLANAARKAANDIDPLTGKIVEGSTALGDYQKQLNDLEFSKLEEAVTKSAEHLRSLTDFVPKFIDRFTDGLQQLGMFINSAHQTYITAWSGQWKKAYDNFMKDMEKRNDRLKTMSKDLDLREQIKEGTIAWEELDRVIKGFDPNNMTKSQKAIKEGFEGLNNVSVNFINHLREINKVDLSQSVESFERWAVGIGKTGDELKSLVYMFGQMKTKFDSEIKDILDKWSKDTEGEFSLTKNLREYEEALKNVGVTISEKDKEELKNIDKKRKSQVLLYETLLKEEIRLREDQNTTQAQWELHFQRKKDLENEVRSDNSQLSQNKIIDQITEFDRITKAHKDHLKDNEENDKQSEEEKARKRIDINDQYIKDLKNLMKKGVPEIVKDSEGISDNFTTSLEKSSRAFKRLEDQAKETWTNIGNTSKLTTDDKTSGINAWIDSIQKNMKELGNSTGESLIKIKNNLLAAIKSDASVEELDKIKKAFLEIAERGAESYEQMGESISNVIDTLVAEEKKLLDNIEKYANQIIGVQKEVDDYRRSINQEQMGDLEKYQDNKLKMEELFALAATKTREAERATGEERLKLFEAANTANKEAYELSKKLNASKKQESDDDKKAAEERKKAAEQQKTINELLGKEKIDQDKISKAREKIAEHNKKALEYDAAHAKFLNERVTIEQSLLDRKMAADKYEKEQIKNLERMKKDEEEDLPGVQQTLENAKQTKKELDEIVQFLEKGVDFKVDFKGAKNDLWAFEQDLIEILNVDFKFTVPTKELEDTKNSIMNIGGTWTNVWTEAENEAKRSVKTMNEALKELKNQKVEIKFEGSGSTTKPLTEKINELKQKLKTLAGDNFDFVINVTLKSFDLVMAQLDSIIAKLAEIKDKEITIKINKEYTDSGGSTETSGAEGLYGFKHPEKKRHGGKLAGYGGGDKIPVLAEAGEWWINKEAVKKYGDSFISSINNMSLPKFQLGGKVMSSLNNLGNSETNNIVNNWNLTIGTETYAPRGRVKSIAEQLISEVRGVY